MKTYGEDAIAGAAACTPRQLTTWTKALAKHGLAVQDGQVPLNHAVAIGAAIKLSQAGVGKARVDALFRRLLGSFPDGNDWLVVDRRNRAHPIAVEAAPFQSGKTLTERNRAPIVFDPIAFIDQLEAH